MKALILAGGEGTRLRPITHTSAKQLVPVANKPVLYYCLHSIAEAGIKEVIIIVGDTQDEIKEAIGNGEQFGVSVSYVYQERPLGLAHAVKIAQKELGNEEFVMFLGDNLIKDGIKTLVDEFKSNKPNAQILLAEVEDPKRFGVAELNGDNTVKKLVEKPKTPVSNLALVGVYMFDKNIFEAVNAIKPSWRDELEITDAIQYMIDKGLTVEPHIIQGWWKDTGKLEDMLEANRMILEDLKEGCLGQVDNKSKIVGKVFIDEGARVINSTIRGPAVIGKNTVIEHSYIGPFTSIYYDCQVIDSEIEHSIVLEGSAVKSINRLSDSLIGKNVEVVKSNKKPKAYRLMVGDNSKVGI
ncbi:MAG: glucose-1-phosphate thymidylyltransferase [Actinobacteria bacterium]|nr:MAG: glucose-1-phosphate thymidylyltransferase [Actinomycetota bacterium]